MNKELEKTKQEAMSMWNRTKEDDEQRVAKINADKKFRDQEFMKREEIMRRGQEERLAADLARKEEIKRQEELLSGRRIRAKTTDLSVDKPEGGGIQIYHYKDPGELLFYNPCLIFIVSVWFVSLFLNGPKVKPKLTFNN